MSLFSYSKDDDKKRPSHVWMYSFTDMLLILITFFVMLAALGHDRVGVPPPEISADFEDFNGNQSLGMREEIETEPHNMHYEPIIRGVNLDYLAVLLNQEFDGLKLSDDSENPDAAFDVVFTRQSDRLVVSLPSDLLFVSGGYELTDDGNAAIRQVVEVIKRLRNQVVVYGHADPNPVGGSGFSSNWELSLDRALSVSRALAAAGYDLPVRPHGLSSSRFGELSEDLSMEERYALARRVDIVILADGVQLY